MHGKHYLLHYPLFSVQGSSLLRNLNLTVLNIESCFLKRLIDIYIEAREKYIKHVLTKFCEIIMAKSK